MFRISLRIAAKDIRLVLIRGGGLIQALMLGLLLIVLFSVARRGNEVLQPQLAATIFWIASSFCQILLANMLFSLEETCQTRAGLLLMPAKVQAVWLGKALAAFVALIVAQVLLGMAMIVFLDQSFSVTWPEAIMILLLVDVGMVLVGALLGALAQGQSARESLLAIVLFPLLVPILLAGIHTTASALGLESPDEFSMWLGLVLAFDAFFAGAGLLLFPFVFGDA